MIYNIILFLDPNIHTCLPSETVTIRKVNINSLKCIHQCEQTDYETTVTMSSMAHEPIVEYLKAVNEYRGCDARYEFKSYNC